METVVLHCSLCSLFGLDIKNGSHFSSMDEANKHARIHSGQIKMLEDGEIDEEQMFERCFPNSTQIIDQEVSSKGRRSLSDFIRSLLGKRAEQSCIDCNLCGNSIGIMQVTKLFRSNSIITHACVHAGVKPFKCRRCENSFRARSNFWRHFTYAHGPKPTNQDFEDQYESFYDEISNSIERCFTKCKNAAPSKEMKDKTREYIVARSRRMANASELSIQRQSFFNRAVKKNASSDGKIKCRLCSREIKATRNVGPNGGGTYTSLLAIQHAQYHLRKPLYRCATCNEARNTYPAMKKHLKKKHTLGMDNNYECFADKFHSDILAIFAQCFGKD